MYKLLIVEDDVMMSDMLSMYLSEEGYEVRQALTGESGLELLEQFVPDLLLLDLILPDWDGTELCAKIRQTSNLPIMIVSMKQEVSERIQALRAGADDYLCKPFSMHELSARAAALIRRTILMQPVATLSSKESGTGQTGNSERIELPIQLDTERRLLLVHGTLVVTTFSEFELMKLFLNHPGKVFSREDLINAIRGFDSFVTDRAIDVHIVNLRRKVEKNPKEPKYIRTVWGVGYKYMTDSD
ncbi:DNA-binding response regulator [Paenibacillus baekrokdamisoli]|uniref:DNA-binding response regulator n=1 Tax=Paenibacillus baekrokdamisoli TaxID=1712516 RepID=A0A3G9JAA0_9BACL|nr:response regulator transcription factor [Paenibacillus baekrokdamisoli]MBB3068185.1 DNA-binding response OmpR family regulator [Paenibacillus baekrokdamisoli]BBH22771.1 DNA-binding response regulator [Paenibacillus baekrokdamisoli]